MNSSGRSDISIEVPASLKAMLPPGPLSDRVLYAVCTYLGQVRSTKSSVDAGATLRENFGIGKMLGIGIDDAILEVLDMLEIPERYLGDQRIGERSMVTVGDLGSYVFEVAALYLEDGRE